MSTEAYNVECLLLLMCSLGKDPMGNEVLLPRKYLLEEFELEQEIDVFVFKDSEQRIVSTTETPYLFLGEFK